MWLTQFLIRLTRTFLIYVKPHTFLIYVTAHTIPGYVAHHGLATSPTQILIYVAHPQF
jgi:hypothetical protein